MALEAKGRIRVLILVGDVLAFVGGIALSYVEEVGFRASVSGSLFVIALITFLGFLALAEDMRGAMAAAFVLVYFAMLFTIVFADVGELNTDARQILGNFTTLVGVVVTFYFGATAAERVASIRSQSSATEATPKL